MQNSSKMYLKYQGDEKKISQQYEVFQIHFNISVISMVLISIYSDFFVNEKCTIYLIYSVTGELSVL